MAIDATVWDVTRDHGLKLWLSDREPDGIAGQSRLDVLGTCPSAELLVGRNIWAASSGPIICGDIQIGERIGCTACVLHDRAIRQLTR